MESKIDLRLRDSQYWNTPDDTLVPTEIAASMLCRSKRTLEGWRLRGIGPAYCHGRPVLYSVGGLRRFKMKQMVKPID